MADEHSASNGGVALAAGIGTIDASAALAGGFAQTAQQFMSVFQTVRLVAWHHWVGGTSDCPSLEISRDRGPKRLQKSPCAKVPPEQQQPGRIKAAHDRFMPSGRSLGSSTIPPEGFYVRKILRSMFEGTGALPDVAWMWNPRYYKHTLTTKIDYEAYPESQAEVDELVARFHLRRVIYDP